MGEPQVLRGGFQTLDDIDYFWLDVKKSQIYVFTPESVPLNSVNTQNPRLKLYKGSQNLLPDSGDPFTGAIVFEADFTDRVYIAVSSGVNKYIGGYRVIIDRVNLSIVEKLRGFSNKID